MSKDNDNFVHVSGRQSNLPDSGGWFVWPQRESRWVCTYRLRWENYFLSPLHPDRIPIPIHGIKCMSYKLILFASHYAINVPGQTNASWWGALAETEILFQYLLYFNSSCFILNIYMLYFVFMIVYILRACLSLTE